MRRRGQNGGIADKLVRLCAKSREPAPNRRQRSNLNILRDLGNIALIVYIFLGCRASFSQVRVTDAFLQNPASPLLSVDVPLTTALSNIGYSLKSDGYILFGTTVVLNEMGEEPRVTLNLLPGDTVQRAIDSLSQQLPEYRWVLVYDHLMNVFPAQQTRCDLLDTRFDQLDIKNQNPANTLGGAGVLYSGVASSNYVRISRKRTGWRNRIWILNRTE